MNRPIPVEYVDNTSSLIQYEPSIESWWSGSVLGSYIDSLQTCSVNRASATLTFNGVEATLYGMKRSDMGIGDVYINGKFVASIDFYNSTEQKFQLLYTTPQLPPGDHTLTIVRAGANNPASTASDGKINIDAFSYKRLADTTPPARPATVTSVSGMDSIRLNWANNTEADLDSYNVYRKDASGFRELVGACVKKSFFLDVNLPVNRTYDYEVTALDRGGNESLPRAISASVSGVPLSIDNDSGSVAYANGTWRKFEDANAST